MPITTTIDASELNTDQRRNWARVQIREFARRNAAAPEVASFPSDLDAASDEDLAAALGVVLGYRQNRAVNQQFRGLEPTSPRNVIRKYQTLDNAGKQAVLAVLDTERGRVVAEAQAAAQGGGKKGG